MSKLIDYVALTRIDFGTEVKNIGDPLQLTEADAKELLIGKAIGLPPVKIEQAPETDLAAALQQAQKQIDWHARTLARNNEEHAELHAALEQSTADTEALQTAKAKAESDLAELQLQHDQVVAAKDSLAAELDETKAKLTAALASAGTTKTTTKK